MGGDAILQIVLRARDEASSQLKSFGESLGQIGEIAAGIGLERVTEQVVELGKQAAEFAVDVSAKFVFIKIRL